MTIQQRDDRTVVAAIGDVVLSRSDPTGLATIEIRADAAVIYMAATAADEGPDGAPEPDDSTVSPLGPVSDMPGAAVPAVGRVEAAYLEGDIVLTYGDRTVRSSRLYYDFENDRALILDAVAFMPAPGRDVPIYVRAARPLGEIVSRETITEPRKPKRTTKEIRELETTAARARAAAQAAADAETAEAGVGGGPGMGGRGRGGFGGMRGGRGGRF